MTPMSEWPLMWERISLQSVGGKYRMRTQSQVPWRQCPHGVLHFDEKIAPPEVRNAWMTVPDRCPHHACRRAVRRNNAPRQKVVA